MTDTTGESPVQELLTALHATPSNGAGSFTATAPDWFGDRVFGGLVVGQAVDAACESMAGPAVLHSVHATFLGALRPGPVAIETTALRDGRTFSTRHVTSSQNGRAALWLNASFHVPEPGDEYQLSWPEEPPAPESLPSAEGPPPFELRELGPTERRPDGTFASTRRCWARTVEPLSDASLADDPRPHVIAAAFLSDMTGTSFRPESLETWGSHTDASIDHAVWFHRPFRLDEWCYCDFHALATTGGRSTVRGTFYDQDGRLCMSMAQELLIRPLAVPIDEPNVGL